MPEASTVIQGLVVLVALYGAILSSYNTFHLRRQDRRLVKMSMNQKILVVDGLGPSFLCLRATNVGQRHVTIEHISLQLPDGRQLAMPGTGAQLGFKNTPLPATLDEGQSACAYMLCDGIGRTLLREYLPDPVMLTAMSEDSVGGLYLSEPWTITPRDWVDK